MNLQPVEARAVLVGDLGDLAADRVLPQTQRFGHGLAADFHTWYYQPVTTPWPAGLFHLVAVVAVVVGMIRLTDLFVSFRLAVMRSSAQRRRFSRRLDELKARARESQTDQPVATATDAHGGAVHAGPATTGS